MQAEFATTAELQERADVRSIALKAKGYDDRSICYLTLGEACLCLSQHLSQGACFRLGSTVYAIGSNCNEGVNERRTSSLSAVRITHSEH